MRSHPQTDYPIAGAEGNDRFGYIFGGVRVKTLAMPLSDGGDPCF